VRWSDDSVDVNGEDEGGDELSGESKEDEADRFGGGQGS
jgi:hypothetical protein